MTNDEKADQKYEAQMSDMEPSEPVSDSVVMKVVDEWQRSVKDVFTLEEQLKDAKERQRRFELSVLPALFDERGWAGITLANGRRVEIKDVLHVSLVKGQGRDEALTFLRENGASGAIKQGVEITETDDIKQVVDILTYHAIGFQLKEDIHPNTLKAVVRELLGLQTGTTRFTVDELPKGLGAFVERKAELK